MPAFFLNALKGQHPVAKLVTQDPLIFDQPLGKHFDKWISKLITSASPTFIVVVDALGECEKERDKEAIVDTRSRLAHLTTNRHKPFLTGQSELHVQLGFKDISTAVY